MSIAMIKLLYVPCKNQAEAKHIASKTIELKLAACANILPMNSLYIWEGKLQDDAEVLLLLKTTKEKIDALKLDVKKHHSYAVPCLLEIDGDVNQEYERWMYDSMSN